MPIGIKFFTHLILLVCIPNKNSSFTNVIIVENGTTHLVLLKQKNVGNVTILFHLKILQSLLNYVQ